MSKRRPDPDDVLKILRRREHAERHSRANRTPRSTCRAELRKVPLRELPLSPGQREIQRQGGLEANARCFLFGECSILVGRGPQGWHVSIAHPNRYPTWDEIAEVRYRLIPDDVTVAMILPPSSTYVNNHPNCFHLWEIEGHQP